MQIRAKLTFWTRNVTKLLTQCCLPINRHQSVQQRPWMSCCESGDNISVSILWGKFLYFLPTCVLSKTDYGPCFYPISCIVTFTCASLKQLVSFLQQRSACNPRAFRVGIAVNKTTLGGRFFQKAPPHYVANISPSEPLSLFTTLLIHLTIN